MPDGTASLQLAASALGDSLLRAAWQGGLALALAWLLTRTGRLAPAAQCWLWRLALLKLLIAAFWATPLDLPVLPAGQGALGVRPWALGSDPLAVRTASGMPGSVPGSRPDGEALRVRPWARSEAFGVRPRALGSDPRVVATPSDPGGSLLGPNAQGPTPTPLRTQEWPLAAAAVWALGVLACALRMAADWRRAQRLRRSAVPTRDAALQAWLVELCGELGIRRAPLLLESSTLQIPALVCGWQPCIVLPAAVLPACSGAECRMMLAHELAHLRRGDLVWGWLPAVACTLFFFHPLVWLARREAQLSQEMACDHLAVSVAGAAASSYGELLLKVAALPSPSLEPGLASLGGVDESARTLRRRLTMLMQYTGRALRRPSNGRWRPAGMLLVVGVSLVALVPWRVTAQERPAEKPAVPESAQPTLTFTAGPQSAAPSTAPAVRGAPSPSTAASLQDRSVVPAAKDPNGGAASLDGLAATPGTPGDAVSEQWEDVLLLEAMRYLRVSADQRSQLLTLARPVDDRLKAVREEEKRALVRLAQIARRNREALLAGRPGNDQNDALLLKRSLMQKRATVERELVDWLMSRMPRTMTRDQMIRAILLTLNEPVQDRNRVLGAALLDPAAGFVLAQVTDAPQQPPDAAVRERVNQVQARWEQQRDAALRADLARRYPPDVLSQLPTKLFLFSDVTFTNVSPRLLSVKLTTGETKELLLDNVEGAEPAGRPEVAAAQREFQSLQSRTQRSTAQVLQTEATEEDLLAALRPFVRRFFLSPRLRPLLEERTGR
jgi:beta-lactamase regulating signal transducer with metallopeptidase domain